MSNRHGNTRPPITLRSIAEELAALEESHGLLEKLYLEIGPYQDGKITKETWAKVRDHFGFDDSE